MKKTILFTMLALLGMIQAAAQEYEYVPLVREGVKWVYYYINDTIPYPADPNLPVGKVYLTLELKGDTVIADKTYKVMHKYYGEAINEENDTIPICLREENKIVYGIVPEGKTYPDCPISCYGNMTVYSQIRNGEEFILYDFSDPVSFSYEMSYIYQIKLEDGFNPFKFSDMVTVNGHLAKRYVFMGFGDCCLIEGIGFDGLTQGYLLAYQNETLSGSPKFFFSHVIEDGTEIYHSVNVNNYKPYIEYLPITRSGVKWVNEHVTISNGDTTRYYYTYEFKPIENNRYDYNCFFSTQEETNPVTDSIVSLAREMGYEFECIRNKKLESLIQNGDNMIDFWGHDTFNDILTLYYSLYYFVPIDISGRCILNYYIMQQKEDFLNRNNFIEIDPLIIEGVSCSRYAYISEEGDTLAYVVEGIGFDSRDMGDLLTPFTRKPDPNADYQEWCGLSHVIKDGQIIYKGLRYREGAFDGIDEVAADKTRSGIDDNYYDLMGRAVGKDVPTMPGIFIHQGKKIVIR